MNTSQDIKMQMVDDNVGNQERQNVVQYDGNEVGQNAVHNPGIQNVENMNGLSVVPEIANQYGNGNVVTAPAEGNGNGINGNPIRCYNCRGEGHYASNCTVKPRKRDAAYLQQQLQIAQEEEAGIQSTQVECKFMAAADAYEETERVKVNCTLENAKLEVVCAMCKQCFVTGNHDVCVLNYVNDMNSRADNQSANVSKLENQKKHKANVRKSKELGSQGSLASSRPSKPRNYLRWVKVERSTRFYRLSHSEIVDIEKVAVRSSL
ncbi:gag-pol polyprotein [Tanacetum coccineum]